MGYMYMSFFSGTKQNLTRNGVYFNVIGFIGYNNNAFCEE